MRLLLDSHVLLWWKMSPDRSGAAAIEAISQADAVFVSAATAWELGLQASLGKLRIPEPVELALLPVL